MFFSGKNFCGGSVWGPIPLLADTPYPYSTVYLNMLIAANVAQITIYLVL